MSDPNQPPFNSPPPPPPPAGHPQPVPYAHGPSPYGYPGPYQGPPPDGDARTMALLAHLLGIFTSVLGPLIIWLIKKDQQPFVDDQGKEALNFQITALIGWVAAVLLSCLSFGILFFLPFVWWVLLLVFGILACIEANKGNAYRYPINIRLVK